MNTAYCSACAEFQPVDGNWRALWIDSDGDLRISALGRAENRQYDRERVVLVCGQGTALVLTERYLHSGSFEQAHAAELSLAQAAREPNNLYPELT